VKRIAVVIAVVAALAALLIPAASAHPLGNFTINRSATLDVSGNRLYVSYVLDLAEVPTFQDEQAGVHAADYLRRIERGLHVTVAGEPVALRPVARRLAHPRGQGGLKTTRFEIVFAGPELGGTQEIRLADDTYGSRIGWKEVVVRARAGGDVVSASAPATSPTLARRYLSMTSTELRDGPKTMVGTLARTKSAAKLTACLSVLARICSSSFTTGGL
jgi:hypothetical protein